MRNQIILEGLSFYAYHGCYEQERKLGNTFEIDISVQTNLTSDIIEDSLSATIDYEAIYEVIEYEMKIPSKLLEHVGYRIINKIKEAFPEIIAIELEIAKLSPPLKGQCRKSKIKLQA